MSGLIYNPDADKRSIMMNKPPICNGAKTGRSCEYYWNHIAKVESNNSDNLKDGQKFRVCLRSPSIALEFSSDQIPTKCNQYTPRKKSLLVLLGLRSDRGNYDTAFEDYAPLDPEEIRDLQDDGNDGDYITAESAIADLSREVAEKIAAHEVSIDEAMAELGEKQPPAPPY